MLFGMGTGVATGSPILRIILLEIAVGLPFQRVYQLGGDRQVADPGIVSAARSDFFTIGGIGAYDERVTAQWL